MRFTNQRINKDICYTKQEDFIIHSKRLSERHFTRTRKMPLSRLLLSILNRRGLSLSLELRKFKELSGMKEEISKSGYLRQRMKLNPDSIAELFCFHNKGLYDDGEMETWKGYYILAADGSGINVPTTPETLVCYGSSSRKGTKPQAALGLSCIYDVINHTILECSINDCKFNEMQEAYRQMQQIKNGMALHNTILVLDRGYPSSVYFIKMLEENQKFLVRLKASDFKKEHQGMKSMDEEVEIVFDKSRMQHYLGSETASKMKELGSIRIRFVRLTLENGTDEYLATNLTNTEYTTEEIRLMYTMRWEIETAYDMLKNNLELENFTGTKPVLIEQDIYSSVYLCNLAQDMIADANHQQKGENVRKYKHSMTVNKTYAVGVLKEELIHILLEPASIDTEKRFKTMVDELKRNLIPVRKDRHYKRTKGNLAAKYSNTHKRSY